MSDNKAAITRFSIAQRIEHILLFVSFTTLGLTGLIQKYIGSEISLFLIRSLGGIESVRIIHRAAAIIFALETLYHVVILGYKIFVRREEMSMLPGIQDAKDGIQAVGYNLGLAKSRPRMGRYSFDEKLEYWAMIWGGVVMGITGFMLWNPIITTRILPGVFIPAAKVAHGMEAVLAVVAILIWHLYHVHIKNFNKSMFTGKLTRHEMEEDHPLELVKIDAGVKPVVKPAELKKRKMVFYPLAILVSLAGFVGIYYWLTAETTSITTLPPAERVEIISTRVPTPLPTVAPAEQKPADAAPAADSAVALTWDGGVSAVFKDKCVMCHGPSGGFTASDYASVMKGVTPADPEKSIAYTIQTAGGHPGQFDAAQLDLVKRWIEAGAPEK